MIGTLLIAAAGTGRWVRRTQAAKLSHAMQGDRAQGKVVDFVHRRPSYRPVIGFYTRAGQWVEFTGDMTMEKSDKGRELEVAYDPANPWKTAVVISEDVLRRQAADARIGGVLLLAAGIALIAVGIFG